METIILVGHGSPKKDANRMEVVGRLLHGMMHPGCTKDCIKVCYLQFKQPDLKTCIKEIVVKKQKPSRVVIHPYFLNSGMHVTKDIPEMIEEARALYPYIEFIYTEPLGVAAEIAAVAKERIEAAKGEIRPSEIEKRSFEKIAKEAGPLSDAALPEDETRSIVQRVVHATGDFEFINTLIFHPDAVKAGVEAIKSGMDIITDVEMVRAGINEKALSGFGGMALCGIKDVSGDHADKTRAERGFCDLAIKEKNAGIYVIGNAPTALFACIKLVNEGVLKPKLVIGVPVGFVRAVEAKAFLAAQGKKFPFITNAGRKGGSTVAAAIVNALLLMAQEGTKNQ
ncbi:MAG: precorrin-8X methylmutase [Nitrospiraceae bacterium]|nr:precorrin-8X methylmutase [Nitrospiraceae bacterium]